MLVKRARSILISALLAQVEGAGEEVEWSEHAGGAAASSGEGCWVVLDGCISAVLGDVLVPLASGECRRVRWFRVQGSGFRKPVPSTLGHALSALRTHVVFLVEPVNFHWRHKEPRPRCRK